MTKGADGQIAKDRAGRPCWWLKCYRCGMFGHTSGNCGAEMKIVNQITGGEMDDDEVRSGYSGSMAEFPEEVDGEQYSDNP